MTSIPTVTLNGPTSVQMPRFGIGYWEVPQDVTAGLVTQALSAGYRLIDTAMIYQNEQGVGQGMADSDVPREDLFLTTKVWNSDQGRDATLAAFETSLSKLGTDYLDLYLIHWPTPKLDRYVDTWRAMQQLRDEGRIKAIGVCNFGVEHLQRVHDETGEFPAVNQVELHPYLTQEPLRAFHATHGIVTEDWSPLAARASLLDDPVVAGIAKDTGASAAQVVYAWHLAIGSVVIPRTTKPERLAENLAAVDLELTAEQVAALSALNRDQRTGPDPATFNLA